MFMQKSDRNAIYTVLFRSAVMFAERALQKRHPDKSLNHLTNLQVIKILKSLKSRGYVSEQIAWRHYYWCLNNDGIEYLRGYLHMPSEVVPSTLQRRKEPVRMSRNSRDDGTRGLQRDFKEREDRSTYRRNDEDKTGEVGAGAGSLEFRGGFGRGRR
ncbi:40S ribosomal protein S10b-like [Drosophila albomicans]|uniref:40S ribosomal protein S10b-like n=1 Tax=Drosophila albomicans TaxID=7291 RepID=A0A6P8W227_DROAB|nr:40S ribosomal protein S10b-like [Drosophila albomicans]